MIKKKSVKTRYLKNQRILFESTLIGFPFKSALVNKQPFTKVLCSWLKQQDA